MGKIIWAPSALSDIEAIAQYIERDSAEQASLFVTRVIEMTDRLAKFPLSGRVIPEINHDSCREVIYGTYRILCIVSLRVKFELRVLFMELKTGIRNFEIILNYCSCNIFFKSPFPCISVIISQPPTNSPLI